MLSALLDIQSLQKSKNRDKISPTLCFLYRRYLGELVSPFLANRRRRRPLLWVVRLDRRLSRSSGVGVGRVNRHGRMRCLQLVVVASQGRHERIKRLTKSRCGIATSRHRHSVVIGLPIASDRAATTAETPADSNSRLRRDKSKSLARPSVTS